MRVISSISVSIIRMPKKLMKNWKKTHWSAYCTPRPKWSNSKDFPTLPSKSSSHSNWESTIVGSQKRPSIPLSAVTKLSKNEWFRNQSFPTYHRTTLMGHAYAISYNFIRDAGNLARRGAIQSIIDLNSIEGDRQRDARHPRQPQRKSNLRAPHE
jgi:hypothetical protein